MSFARRIFLQKLHNMLVILIKMNQLIFICCSHGNVCERYRQVQLCSKENCNSYFKKKKKSSYMHHSENYCGGCGVQMEYSSVRPITSKINQIEVSVNISVFFSYIFKSHAFSTIVLGFVVGGSNGWKAFLTIWNRMYIFRFPPSNS